MKATELLKSQHRSVKDLFEHFEEASQSDKAGIFEEIASALVGHDAIEREIFYPACEKALKEKDEDILGESLVEHEVVEFCLFRCDDHRNHDDIDKYVTVLKEVVEHHVEEEEKELFPKAERALGAEQSEAIGEKLVKRFAELQKLNFRAPLGVSLQRLHLKEAKERVRSKIAPRKAAKKRQTASTKRRAR